MRWTGVQDSAGISDKNDSGKMFTQPNSNITHGITYAELMTAAWPVAVRAHAGFIHNQGVVLLLDLVKYSCQNWVINAFGCIIQRTASAEW